MSKLKTVLLLSPLLLMNDFTAAACPPPAGHLPSVSFASTPKDTTSSRITTYKTRHYWKQCYATVEIHSFNGQALKSLENLKTMYQQKYHTILLAQLTEASQNRIAAIQGGYQTIIQILNENYNALLEAETKMKTEMMSAKLDYQKDLAEKAFNEKNVGFFSDGNGEGGIVRTDTQSYEYFKNVCRRNKMFNKTASPVYQEKRSQSLNNSVISKTKAVVEGGAGSSSSVALSRNVINTHLNDYCDPMEIKYNQCVNPLLKLCVAGDVDSGVCESTDGAIYELVNKDIDAINLVSPKGYDGKYTYDKRELEAPKNRIEDELFDVKYTYDEGQLQAAKDYANNLIYQAGVITPSMADKTDKSKAEYVAAYNNYIANLNLSNYAFQNAIKAREPITDGEIKMSERDILRYIMHNLEDPDVNSATMAAKDKGKELMIYQLISVQNKLNALKYEQKEMINSLLAAMVSQGANNPDLIKKLNSLK